MNRPSFSAAHYLASGATLPLGQVLAALEDAFEFPAFELDGKASWEFAYSERPGLALNVTRARRPDVIETWVEGTPPGSTFQFIVYSGFRGPTHEDVSEVLAERCGMATQYIKTSSITHPPGPMFPAKVGEYPAPWSEESEPPSGWSLPLSWIIVLGLVAAVAFGVRACA